MEIKELKKIQHIDQDRKLNSTYSQFNNLIYALRKKEIPEDMIISINKDIDYLNDIKNSNKQLRKEIRRTQNKILKLVEKELKLVTKNHYQKTWLAVGMAAFGIPLGAAFGTSLGNMAFIGIGLPIGMAIGIAIGTSMDQKASKEGKQLDLEIKS